MISTVIVALIMLGLSAVAIYFLKQSFAKSEDILREQLEWRDDELQVMREERDAFKNKSIALEAKIEESYKRIADKEKALEDAASAMGSKFEALSKNSLESNNKMFLELAKSTMENYVTQIKGDMGKGQESIKNIVQPLENSLKQYDSEIKRLESERQKSYGSLEKHIETLQSASSVLQKETGNLVNALRKPHVRGRWGEVTLKRVVELAGMSEYCDFTEQTTVSDEEGKRLRPDMLVRLPNERLIVVDAKTPLSAYLDALEADTEEDRLEHIQRHVNHVKEHLKQLSKKDYALQFDQTPEFVVMFIPGESFFSAALEQDKSLVEEGFEKGVIMATPTTLIALLKSVAYGWRQEQMTKNAAQVQILGKELYERMQTFLKHFKTIGSSLNKAVDSYNKSTSSLETRVLVTARKFPTLGVAAKEEITEPEPIEKLPRDLQVEEL